MARDEESMGTMRKRWLLVVTDYRRFSNRYEGNLRGSSRVADSTQTIARP
jgi:hypothetical protein